VSLLSLAGALFHQGRGRGSSTSCFSQLLIIVSDGRGIFHEGREKVTQVNGLVPGPYAQGTHQFLVRFMKIRAIENLTLGHLNKIMLSDSEYGTGQIVQYISNSDLFSEIILNL
jgi:hypothetical protein